MTRIHHATAAKAEKLGIKLSPSENGVTASLPKQKDRQNDFEFAKAPEALAAAELEKMLRAEYPALALTVMELEDPIYTVTFLPADAVVYTYNAFPSLAELLEECENESLDPTEGLADQEDEGGSVVSHRYKEEYAARGNPDHCGDELAVLMDGQFVLRDEAGNESFDPEAFLAFLSMNNVDTSGKWAQIGASNGWKGRLRMNGRQKLEQIVVETGVVVMPNNSKVTISAEQIEVYRERHRKVLEKRAKARDALAQASA